MRIIIVGTAYPLRGGIAHYNALLAEHLGARHEVATITFKRQYPSLLFPGKSQEEEGDPGNAAAAPRLIDSINPLTWVRASRDISRRRPDLLIFKYWLPFFAPCFGFIAAGVRKRTGAKVLFICDNIIPHERRPGDVALTRYAFRRADCFIVQSDAVERDLRRNFPGARYRKVPHPVYENFGSPIPREEARRKLGIAAARVILYFGYVRAYKGLHVLIDAVKRLVGPGGSTKDLLLLAAGEFYEDRAPYDRQIRDLDLGSSVRLVADYIPNDQVGLYFSAADLVVLPYLSATQSGIAQIAYNFDRPVIATAVGGLAEVIIDGRTGYIVPPGDPAALAAAIGRFYAEARETEFSSNVKQEKTKYSWDHLVTQIEELVSECRR